MLIFIVDDSLAEELFFLVRLFSSKMVDLEVDSAPAPPTLNKRPDPHPKKILIVPQANPRRNNPAITLNALLTYSSPDIDPKPMNKSLIITARATTPTKTSCQFIF